LPVNVFGIIAFKKKRAMNKIDCILYIDKGNVNQLEDGFIREVIEVNSLVRSFDTEKAMEFIEQGCILEDRKCPEFIFIDLGSQSIHQEDFYNALQKINQAIVIKIQVVFLLDPENINELDEIKALGIEHIFKPLDKAKLQSIFDRYFLLKNPVI
jgi:hypothetical protein